MPISWDIGLSYPRDVYSDKDAFNVWDVKQNIKKPVAFRSHLYQTHWT